MTWHWLKYVAGFTIPAATAISFLSEGYGTWLAIFYGFVILPTLELFLPSSRTNLTAAEVEVVKEDKGYDWMLWSMVLVQYALLVWFLFDLSTGARDMWSFEWWGFVLAMGLSCSILGINVAHELGHRREKHNQLMAQALLTTSLYTHFFIEHNQGHHRNVATEEDPGTARRNEWLQVFWCRAVFLAWYSAWEIEAKNMRRRGRSPWHASNLFLRLQALQWGLLATVWIVLGWQVGVAWLIAGLFGGFLLEVVNYVEHYGLERKRINEHRYERVMPHHSWNSDHPLGRLILFELTRHSDHHHQPAKPYQTLNSIQEAPQLPTGYPGMMLLSLIPPLYFAVMNPRVDAIAAQHAD
tara:strand:- start:6776 stop:7837 length:1062 start_codon:yes stop_codon:yes gene_type:complete